MTSRRIFIHVEEPSMEAYLGILLPRLNLPTSPVIINHRSKEQLLRTLPARLAGYAQMPIAVRPLVVVLVDRDDDDCAVLKRRLEDSASACNLATKTNPRLGQFDVVNRIVVEELESWHFGEVAALCAAFPGIPATLARKTPYRDPDAIRGGTHEALLRELNKAGHYRGATYLPKVEVARLMAERISINANTSHSFRCFHEGLMALVAQGQEAA